MQQYIRIEKSINDNRLFSLCSARTCAFRACLYKHAQQPSLSIPQPIFLTLVALCILLVSSLSNNTQAAGLLLLEQSVDSLTPEVEILGHDVDVRIYNQYAITTVEQTYFNVSANDTNGTYYLQLPARAKLSQFTVWINGKPTNLSMQKAMQEQKAIQERTDSQPQDGATKDTKSTLITNKDIFSIPVTSLPAQQSIKIQLAYIQKVALDEGIGRYTYSPVLNENHSGISSLRTRIANWKLPVFTNAQNLNPDIFNFDLQIDSSVPITALQLHDHSQNAVSKLSENTWRVTLSAKTASTKQRASGYKKKICNDNDTHKINTADIDPDSVTVEWCLDTNAPPVVKVESMKSRVGDSGTFLITFSPGTDLKKLDSGRDWIFVLDSSGSMKDKYAMLAKGMKRALRRLQPDDRYRILNFNNLITEMTAGWQHQKLSNEEQLIEQLHQTRTEGGTDLLAAMKHSFTLPDRTRTTAVVFVTDGEANIGTVEKDSFLQLLKKFDIRLYTIIIGGDEERPLLKAMAEKSNGQTMQVTHASQLFDLLTEITRLPRYNALTNISFELSGIDDSPDIANPVWVTDISSNWTTTLYKDEQLSLAGHYRGDGPMKIVVEGQIAGKNIQYSQKVLLPAMGRRSDPQAYHYLPTYKQQLSLLDMADYLGDEVAQPDTMADFTVAQGLVTNDHTTTLLPPAATLQASRNNDKNKLIGVQGGGAAGYLLLLALPGLRLLRKVL